MKKRIQTMAVAVMANLLLCAQVKSQKISGTILDEEGAPMEFATVVILSLPDSTLLGGGITDADGVFDLPQPSRDFVVQVSMVGYEKKVLHSNIFSKPVKIHLQPSTNNIEGVVVSAQLPRTELKGDAVVTNVVGSVLEHSGNALNVLASVPGMMSNNGKLEVLGRGEPTYYLNGRKITDASELRNLMSEDIKSIEVISNPGALYGGDVRCVVRIRTIKRQGDGFGYALTSQAKQHIYKCHDFEPSWAVLDMNLRSGGRDYFGKVVYWNHRNYQISDFSGSTYANGVSHAQNGAIDHLQHNSGLQYEFGTNLQLNEKHSLGAKVNYDRNVFTRTHTNFNTDVIIDDELTDQLQSESNADAPCNWQCRGNVYYDGTIGKLNVNFNADFLNGHFYSETETNEKSWGAPVEIASSNAAKTAMGAGKLVLSYPVWKGSIMAGAEETFVSSGQEYNITLNNIPAADATLKENTIAGFAQYSMSFSSTQISAGLRFEHVDLDYTDHLVSANSLERHQNNWFPSLNFSAIAGAVKFLVAVTGKTISPDYHMLSNEIMYDTHFIYQSGDPKLHNEKRRTLSVSANYKWLTLSGDYERTDNLFVQWASPFNDEGSVLIKYANLDEPSKILSFYVNASPTVKMWQPRLIVGMRKQMLELTVDDSRVVEGQRDVSLSKCLFLVKASSAIKLPRQWTINADYQFTSPMAKDIYIVKNVLQNLELSVRKSMLKNDALTINLTWTDVLNRQSPQLKMDYGSYVIEQTNDNRQPSVMLRASYRFNSTTSKYKGTGAGQNAKSRL